MENWESFLLLLHLRRNVSRLIAWKFFPHVYFQPTKENPFSTVLFLVDIQKNLQIHSEWRSSMTRSGYEKRKTKFHESTRFIWVGSDWGVWVHESLKPIEYKTLSIRTWDIKSSSQRIRNAILWQTLIYSARNVIFFMKFWWVVKSVCLDFGRRQWHLFVATEAHCGKHETSRSKEYIEIIVRARLSFSDGLRGAFSSSLPSNSRLLYFQRLDASFFAGRMAAITWLTSGRRLLKAVCLHPSAVGNVTYTLLSSQNFSKYNSPFILKRFSCFRNNSRNISRVEALRDSWFIRFLEIDDRLWLWSRECQENYLRLFSVSKQPSLMRLKINTTSLK